MVMERFREVVREDHFDNTPEVLEHYSKDHSFTPPIRPLAIIKPGNDYEIKKVIDLANETRTNLIPTSSGFPKFHGDTIPTMPGVMVDLSGLDQVLRVDRRNRIAIIEPGITFGKLRMELEKEGMVPYTPFLPRSTKSVLASALEREPITVPKDHWNYNDPIAGGEVVIGDGHIQGFGDSAGHSRKEVETGEVVPVMPLGPSGIGWLDMIQGASGTLGIVRWASVRCRIKPSTRKPFFIVVKDLRDVLSFLQNMLRLRFVEELFVLNNSALANVLLEEVEEINKVRPALPPWVLFLNIAGYDRYPEEEVQWKEEQVRVAVADSRLELQDTVNVLTASGLLKRLEMVAEKDWRLRLGESCQVLPFSTTLDRVPKLSTLVTTMATDHGYPSTDLSIYIQPVIQGCQCQCEVIYPYNPQDKQQVQKVKALYRVTAQELSKIGAYYSRPYDMLADITYRDTEVVNVLRKIKAILDPNDIMNRGKLY